jgi:hypothetical protein
MALEPYAIETQDPDDFLRYQLDLAPGIFCQAIRKIRARLTNLPTQSTSTSPPSHAKGSSEPRANSSSSPTSSSHAHQDHN